MNAGPTEPTDVPADVACGVCGKSTEPDRGRVTLWLGERLIVIEGVPALVCRGCGETFYDEDILGRMQKLQGASSARPDPVRVVEAPVYAWSDL